MSHLFFFRGEVTVKKARHFIFCNPTQLKYLADAYAWYIDGTFKIVKDPVKQLLTIHILINSDNQRVSVPVCFVLMARRHKIDYCAVLAEIVRLICQYNKDRTGIADGPRVKKVMADFEIALWQSLRKLSVDVFFCSDLILKGCYFHFA